ncbi:MAG: alpha/beta hydrolase domain-containing protein [Planctomycetota bacterium]
MRFTLATPILVLPLVTLTSASHAAALPSAGGQIDPSTWVSTPHGTFNGVAYTRYEAMFEGATANNRPFRVPCQIIAPANPAQGSGLMLFDWLVASTIPTAVGQEQADARYTLTDEFLFGLGASYATVRCDPAGIGKESPVFHPSRPWSDSLLDTSSEFITSAGDEFDIVVLYQHALRTDPLALQALGTIQRRAGFGYSASGYSLKGLLRMQQGIGLFDFSLVGGTGRGFSHPSGNRIGFTNSERDPRAGAGLEINFQSETEVLVADGHRTRRESANYRVYQFAGAAHIRDIDVVEFGLADPQSANSADWVPFFRALFVAGNRWCNGIQPPASLWLGAPNVANVLRDANGNALVTHVGGQPLSTTAYRLPAVAVGENQYFPFDPSFADGSFLGLLRALAGGRIDLTGNFTSHADYVAQITQHAHGLRAPGYLLEADADAIVQQAILSGIGN